MIDAQIAQLVEQRTENPRVAGSIPALGTMKRTQRMCSLFLYMYKLCIVKISQVIIVILFPLKTLFYMLQM